MTLAYVTTSARGETDRLLTGVAEILEARGVRLCGVVQSNTECSDSDLCDMDVRILPDGPIIRISQSLGRGSRGCRLDPTALEQAVSFVTQSLAETGDARPQMMIVNKFGKHEADGRGFRPLIGEAMLQGIPVLTAVNTTNEAAFATFADGLSHNLPAETASLLNWADRLLSGEEDHLAAGPGVGAETRTDAG